MPLQRVTHRSLDRSADSVGKRFALVRVHLLPSTPQTPRTSASIVPMSNKLHAKLK